MENIKRIGRGILVGIAALIFYHLGEPINNPRIQNDKTDDNDSDYHLFI
jgi:hypothetical protein